MRGSSENEEIPRAVAYPRAMHWLRRHSRGRPPPPDVLTPAEWRVLQQVREGMPNAEIALRLGVSVNTVKSHVSSMLAKLELQDRQELAAWRGSPAPTSRTSRRGWLVVAAQLGGGAVLLGGVVVAFAVASGNPAGFSAGPTPGPAATAALEPTPTTTIPTTTTVAPPIETELLVLQARGLAGCDEQFYVRAWGLPESAAVRVEVVDPPAVLLESETTANGFLNSPAAAPLPECVPGRAYEARLVEPGTGDVLAATEVRIPDVARHVVEVNPAAGGCSGITVTFRGMPPDTRVSLLASGVSPFSHEAWEVITLVTDTTGYAESQPFHPPWSCDTPALALSAFAAEDPEQIQGGGLLYRIALGPDEPIPGLD
ncbi:MAG: hypothetical protein GEU80_06425 [Dehalococcoidia bacterium]|nr:hypothetical protein [Dehalococcoidia bacterium]